MSLKERFTKILYTQSHDDAHCLRIRFENIDKVIDSQEKIADEFAIEFTEWKDDNTLRVDLDGYKVFGDTEKDKPNTLKELLEIFKKLKKDDN